MRIMLVDDHALFLEGMKNLLTAEGDGVNVVGMARNGREALDLVPTLQPDVILMDIQMPECDGLEATRLIKATWPDVQIVILTVSEDDSHLFEANKLGASGYLLKSLDADDFFSLLAGLEKGHAALSPGLATRVLAEFSQQGNAPDQHLDQDTDERLTGRQGEVLKLVARGYRYKEVAALLNLSEPTIKYHMGEIIRRLHLRNRAEVVAYARRMGLDQPDETIDPYNNPDNLY